MNTEYPTSSHVTITTGNMDDLGFWRGSSPAMVWLCTSNVALLLVIPIAILGIQGAI